VQKYSGAVAARPCAGFARDIGGLTPNLVLTWVVTAPDQPPRYVIDINKDCLYTKYARLISWIRIFVVLNIVVYSADILDIYRSI